MSFGCDKVSEVFFMSPKLDLTSYTVRQWAGERDLKEEVLVHAGINFDVEFLSLYSDPNALQEFLRTNSQVSGILFSNLL